MSTGGVRTLGPMTVIAGPCVIEDEGLLHEVAAELKSQLSTEIQSQEIELYFKASFDKANRTSIRSFRGPGMSAGLKLLDQVRSKHGLKLVTDLHTPDQAEPVAEVVDFLQIPAFLCRQTDLVEAAVLAALKHGRRLNIKKGQFLAPWDARNIVDKVQEITKLQSTERGGAQPTRKDWLCLTERGACFGYNALVVDMASFQTMQRFGVPVLYDATHSIQIPGGGAGGASTGGKREILEVLARGAMAAGADGVFLECHPRPAQAKSDGPNAFYLDKVGLFIKQLLLIRKTIHSMPKLLPEAQSS